VRLFVLSPEIEDRDEVEVANWIFSLFSFNSIFKCLVKLKKSLM
jgi:hypothetical protein